MIRHYLDMVSPVKSWVNVDSEVPYRFFGDVHVLRAVDQVNIPYARDRLSNHNRVGVAVGESHEFAFFRIGG